MITEEARVTCPACTPFACPVGRNLEWVTCGANGLLPGQKGRELIFSKAPKTLEFREDYADSRLAMCKGWRPTFRSDIPEDCSDFGYATDSIYYLEVCLFNQVSSSPILLTLFSARVRDSFCPGSTQICDLLCPHAYRSAIITVTYGSSRLERSSSASFPKRDLMNLKKFCYVIPWVMFHPRNASTRWVTHVEHRPKKEQAFRTGAAWRATRA